MTREEIKDFKKFLKERNVELMFYTNYRQNRLTVNPPTLDEYLEKARVENVIPQAFVYPQKLYGKEFWLSIHEEWIKLIQQSRAEKAESDQLESLGLEIIDVKTKNSGIGLPENSCSLSLRGGKRLTLNMEHSKMVAKKLSTHMLLTKSRQTTDVVLMFNRVRGIEVKFRPGSSSLQFNNAELASHLIDLLDLDPAKEYFLLDIELLAETKDYLLFMIKNKGIR
jgi:hypothetical protein